MTSLYRMAALMALASAGLAGPVIIERDPLEEEREALCRAERDVKRKKPEPRPRLVREPPAPKVHTHSREIARRLRQEARKAAKAGDQ